MHIFLFPRREQDYFDMKKKNSTEISHNHMLSLCKTLQNMMTQNKNSMYKRTLRKGRGLSSQEEQTLGIQILNGSDEAVNQLVVTNLAYAFSYAKSFDKGIIPFDDILTAAHLGMCEAARRFDAMRGFCFITYAKCWMHKEISLLLESRKKNTFSLDGYFDHEEGIYSLNDRISNEDALADVNAVITHVDTQKAVSLLQNLSSRENDILCRNFGLYDSEPETMEQIGASYGVTREAVRQMKNRALKKLYQQLVA